MPTSDSRSAKMAKPMKYTVSDGKLVLTLEVAEEDGYIVTVPMDPVIKTIVSTGGGAIFGVSERRNIRRASSRIDMVGVLPRRVGSEKCRMS